VQVEPQVKEKVEKEVRERILKEGLAKGRRAGLAQGKKVGIEQGMERGMEQGKREEALRALHAVLEARGFVVSSTVAKRLASCQQLPQLEQWLRQAVTVAKVNDLFAKPVKEHARSLRTSNPLSAQPSKVPTSLQKRPGAKVNSCPWVCLGAFSSCPQVDTSALALPLVPQRFAEDSPAPVLLTAIGTNPLVDAPFGASYGTPSTHRCYVRKRVWYLHRLPTRKQ
jgi:hypothetical protein